MSMRGREGLLLAACFMVVSSMLVWLGHGLPRADAEHKVERVVHVLEKGDFDREVKEHPGEPRLCLRWGVNETHDFFGEEVETEREHRTCLRASEVETIQAILEREGGKARAMAQTLARSE